jgi:hypothetical protein
MYYKYIHSKMPNECGICMEPITSKSYKTQCSHSFHNKCLTQWLLLNSNCPLCRKEFGPTNTVQETEHYGQIVFIYMCLPEITTTHFYSRIEKQLMAIIEANSDSNTFMVNTNIRIKTKHKTEILYYTINKMNEHRYIIDIFEHEIKCNYKHKFPTLSKKMKCNYLKRSTKCKVLSF